jgi:hypothetical protein
VPPKIHLPRTSWRASQFTVAFSRLGVRIFLLKETACLLVDEEESFDSLASIYC